MTKKGRTSRVIWEGTDEFGRFLRETPGVVVRDVEAALYREGENIMGVSVRRTPVKWGFLKSGGHAKGEPAIPAPWVERPVTHRGKTTVTLAYGADYAIYAHEQEPRTGGSGQSKFLESAVKEGMEGIADKLRRHVLGEIGKRGGH
jgi:hypothetical protein